MNTLLRTAIVGAALLATPHFAFADEAEPKHQMFPFLAHTKAPLLIQVHTHKH